MARKKQPEYDEGMVLAQEVLLDGKVAKVVIFNSTPAGRASVTKVFKVNFQPLGMELGNIHVIGPEREMHQVVMGPVPEDHWSQGRHLQIQFPYYHQEGYTTNALDHFVADMVEQHGLRRMNLRTQHEKADIAWAQDWPHVTEASKIVKRAPTPYKTALVDREAWRAAGRPSGMTKGGNTYKWFTPLGMELVAEIQKVVGKRPEYKMVSERGVTLKYKVPIDYDDGIFRVLCDKLHEDSWPMPNISISDLPGLYIPPPDDVQAEWLARAWQTHDFTNAPCGTRGPSTHKYIKLEYDA